MRSVGTILLLVVLGFAPIDAADNVSYTFTDTDDPILGTFSWTVTAPTVGSDTTIFGSSNSFSSSLACGMSSITIENGPVIHAVTDFSTPCDGTDQDIAGFAGGPVTDPGSYSNSNNSGSTWTLTVFSSDLPITTPEPGTLMLLGLGLFTAAIFASMNRLRHRAR